MATNIDQKTLAGNAPGRRWRDVIKVHPACELFPLLPKDELRALGEDIKAHGMKMPIVLWTDEMYSADRRSRPADMMLLDGRNRLDASELAGVDVFDADGEVATLPIMFFGDVDPYEFVISANIHRRHLTTAQKHELTEKLLKEKPERSDRQIAELVKFDHKTVSKDREKLEAVGEIPQQTHTVTKDGKRRPRTLKEKIDRAVELEAAGKLRPSASVNTPAVDAGAPLYRADPFAFPDADLVPDITAAIELKTPLPRSRSLTPLTPRVNGVPAAQNPVPAKVKKREEAIADIVGHLHHDPTMFLSDVAAIMADDQVRLARVSIFNRRTALAKIARALGLRIADDAWKGA